MSFARPIGGGLIAFLVTAGLAVGCASVEGEEPGEAEGATTSTPAGGALVGVPRIAAFGDRTYGSTGAVLRIKKDDGTTLDRSFTGTSPLKIENDAYGPPLEPIADQRAGWQTGKTKWKCRDAEKFATDTVTFTDRNQLCHVEINPTGGEGFSVAIIGLGANGAGITSYSSPGSAPAPVAVNGGAVQAVSSGPPRTVNVTLDHDAVLDAMVAANTRFNAAIEERNDCLKNARAAGWLDIQAHYYCLLPYNSIRTCYSTKLVEQASSTDAGTRAKAAITAYDTCLAPPANGAADSRNQDAKWLHDKQEAVFKYVMFTKQGVADFELVSENETISDFYTRIGESRPRRVNDVYPAWLMKQPRYDAIRKQQYDAQQQKPGGGR
jgi:hypothetical protein